jgi:hypothetical protein
MQQQVGGAQQMGELLLFDAADRFFDGALVGGAGLGAALAAQVVDRGGQKAAGAAGRVEHPFALVQAWVDELHHRLRDGPRRVELAGVACRPQIVEDLLVDVAQVGAGGEVVELDRLVELFDHPQHQGAGLHVVVGVLEHLPQNLLHVAFRRVDGLQRWKHVVVDERDQFVCRLLRLALLEGGPVAPTVRFVEG